MKSSLIKIGGCLLVAAVILLGSGSTQAANFTIANGDINGLKAAMDTANVNGEDDTIQLAANGTYTLTTVDNAAYNNSGLPVIGSDSGHQLFINGNGATVARSGADGTPEFRIFFVGVGANVTLSALTIANGLISGPHGGGIYNEHGTLAVQNCTLRQNSVLLGAGGAIFSNGDLLIGGGARLSISNSTFTQNSAPDSGGSAIFNNGYGGSAPLSIINSTFSENISNPGYDGGIFNEGYAGSAPIQIGNTILKSGVPGLSTIFNDYAGQLISLGYNLCSDTGVSNHNGGSGAFNATGDQLNTNPLLDPAGLQDHGGPTKTIALLPGSPAIDQGKDFSGTGLDQRGLPRPADHPAIPNAAGGDGSDIGAFELQPIAPSMPDLQVMNITTTNNQAPQGQKVTIKATVANTGSQAAGASMTLFLDGTTVIGSAATPAIPAGYQVDVSVDWRTASLKGSHTLEAHADATNAVAESDEGNNGAQLTVTVKGNQVR